MRQALGKPFFEDFPTPIPQDLVGKSAHLPDATLKSIEPPKLTSEYPKDIQKSSNTANPVDLSSFGSTTKTPLGYIVMGRSGDKSSN